MNAKLRERLRTAGKWLAEVVFERAPDPVVTLVDERNQAAFEAGTKIGYREGYMEGLADSKRALRTLERRHA